MPAGRARSHGANCNLKTDRPSEPSAAARTPEARSRASMLAPVTALVPENKKRRLEDDATMLTAPVQYRTLGTSACCAAAEGIPPGSGADPAVDDEASGLFLLRSITPTGVEDLRLDFEPLPLAHDQPAASGCRDSPAVKLFAGLETSAAHVRTSADARPSAIKRSKRSAPDETLVVAEDRCADLLCDETFGEEVNCSCTGLGAARAGSPEPHVGDSSGASATSNDSSSAITLLLAKANEVVPTAGALPRPVRAALVDWFNVHCVHHRAPVSAVFLALQIFDRVSPSCFQAYAGQDDIDMSWVATLVIVASLSLALKRERRDSMMNVAECVSVANTHFLNVNCVPSTPTDVIQMETKIMFELDWSFQLTPHCTAALWAEALGIDEYGHFGEGEGELSLDIQQTLTRLEQTGEIPEKVPTVALGGVLLIAALARTQRSVCSSRMAQERDRVSGYILKALSHVYPSISTENVSRIVETLLATS